MTYWIGACDGASACVEIRPYAGYVLARAGVDPCVTLPMTEAEWLEFLAAVKRGAFDKVVSDG
ncbi:MAG TPA: hypothetical protein VFY84_12660 [Jiangellales bacterium]|nr:hypothetical protein [Jiangellales bacterium]